MAKDGDQTALTRPAVPISAPAAWVADEFAADESWLHHLAENEIAEVADRLGTGPRGGVNPYAAEPRP